MSPGVIWVCKRVFNRLAARDAEKMEINKEKSKQETELQIKETALLPEMIKIYTVELTAMRAELRATSTHWERRLSDTTNRMEREAMRMMNFIGQLIETMNRMRNRLYLCDTVMHLHDKTWISHNFVEIQIPSFKDPEPQNEPPPHA